MVKEEKDSEREVLLQNSTWFCNEACVGKNDERELLSQQRPKRGEGVKNLQNPVDVVYGCL